MSLSQKSHHAPWFYLPLVTKHGREHYYAKVSKSDERRVKAHSWAALRLPSGRVYAQLSEFGKQQTMARFLLRLDRSDSRVGEHSNGDSLDCRRENIRVGTRITTASRPKKHSSRFTGVSKIKNRLRKPWLAQITRRGRRVFQHFFRTETEAGVAVGKARRLVSAYGGK